MPQRASRGDKPSSERGATSFKCMLLGVHVSAAGRIYETVDRANQLGCNTMQFFARSPQRWRERTLSPGDIAEFRRRVERDRITPLFIHIPYLINLASPEPRLYKASIQAYIDDMREAHLLGVDYIVTHMGSHKKTSEALGLARYTSALEEILQETRDIRVGILLENTAGSGSWLGYTFEHPRSIIDKLGDSSRLGVCLDTAHAFLAGYDLSSKQGLELLIGQIEKALGIERLKLIHLNDALGSRGCRHDRHEHLGSGGIGMQGIERIINHPRLRALPFILETPKDSEQADRLNLSIVRKLRTEPREDKHGV